MFAQVPVIRITAQPRQLSDGSLATLRLAGGGDKSAYYFSSNHWRAGVGDIPRFSVAFGWDDNGWNGAVRAQIANLTWSPSLKADLTAYANNYLWKDAPVTAEVGYEVDGVAPSSWAAILTGKVQAMSAASGQMTFTIADNGATLDQPMVKSFFAGTGGVEGPAEATGREKRRSYGYVFNVEGRILDKVNNIWEFGDPSQQLQAIVEVRDIGRPASPAPTSVAWQGSVAATFAALQAATAVAGSGVIAPSIGCVKWWTQPVGPLTADLIGAGDYGNTATTLAKHLAIENGLTMVTVPSSVTSLMAHTANAGVHVGDDRMTVANALDRLLLGAGVMWRFTAAGVLDVMPIDIANPVATITADSIVRQKVFPPHRKRRIGYLRNERQMSPSELAAVILSGDIGDLNSTVNGFIAPGNFNRVRFTRWEQDALGWFLGISFGSPTITATAFGRPPSGGPMDFAQLTFNFTAASQQVAITPYSSNFGGGQQQFNIPVTPLERIFISAEIWPVGMPAAGRAYMWVVFFDANGTVVNYNGNAGNVAGNILTANPGNWSQQYGFFTVPSGAAFVAVEYLVDNFGTGTATATGVVLNARKLMVVGAAANQTALPDWTPGPGHEAGADLTKNVDGPPQSTVFKYDYTGAAEAGQFNRDLTFKLLTALGQLTTGITASYKVKTGTVNGFTSASAAQTMSVTSGTATLTVSSLGSAEASVEVTMVYNGKPFIKTFPLSKDVASPPITSGGGGGGGGGTVTLDSDTSGFGSISSTTFTTVSTLTGTIPTGKSTDTISVNLVCDPVTTGGAWSGVLECKVLRDNGGGSFTQIGTTQTAASYHTPAAGSEPADHQTADFSFSVGDTGLTAGNSYTYVVQLRLQSGTRQHNISGSPGTSLTS